MHHEHLICLRSRKLQERYFEGACIRSLEPISPYCLELTLFPQALKIREGELGLGSLSEEEGRASLLLSVATAREERRRLHLELAEGAQERTRLKTRVDACEAEARYAGSKVCGCLESMREKPFSAAAFAPRVRLVVFPTMPGCAVPC